jgi:uncharacterized protein YbjT (DUF2867 family)
LAKKLKIKRIVCHSVFKVEHFKDVPHFAAKLAVESVPREFDIPFTILRPNYFFQNDAPLMDVGSKCIEWPEGEALTKLLGHAPRTYAHFDRETVLGWRKSEKAA